MSGFVTGLLGVAIVAAIAGAIVAGRLLNPRAVPGASRGVLFMWMIAIASGVAAAITGKPTLPG